MDIAASFGGRDLSDLKAELQRVQGEIRAKPDDVRLRVFLFQLLAVLGDWNRALSQLQVCGQLSPQAVPMARTYREALRCEVFRDEVFQGKRTPQILGEPDGWIGLLVEATAKLAAGDAAGAGELRERAFDQAPTTAGTLDGSDFEWIADADSRLGPVVEAIVNGQYYWVPFAHLKTIRIEAPTDLRDMVWCSASLTYVNGGESVALIPTRYPGAREAASDALRLARRTEWKELDADTFIGSGQRMWTTDTGETALLDVRHVELLPAASG
jgi:type VI secretion system protein ImpE